VSKTFAANLNNKGVSCFFTHPVCWNNCQQFPSDNRNVNCSACNYWMRLSGIWGISKAEVCVIFRSRRLRQITQTEGLIIPHIPREPNSIREGPYRSKRRSLVLFFRYSCSCIIQYTCKFAYCILIICLLLRTLAFNILLTVQYIQYLQTISAFFSVNSTREKSYEEKRCTRSSGQTMRIDKI
jgi:hypothetical protein